MGQNRSIYAAQRVVHVATQLHIPRPRLRHFQPEEDHRKEPRPRIFHRSPPPILRLCNCLHLQVAYLFSTIQKADPLPFDHQPGNEDYYSIKMNQSWQYTRQGMLSETLEKVEGPIPTPASEEIVVRVKAISLNPIDYKLSVDTSVMTSAYSELTI